jgi:hypothetical protein
MAKKAEMKARGVMGPRHLGEIMLMDSFSFFCFS